MEEEKKIRTEILEDKIRNNLKKVDKLVTSKRKANNRLLITGITTSAASTFIAGITAAGGPLIGTGLEGWRIACIIAAIFGFASTIVTGIGHQMKDSNQLTQGVECIGKLKILDVAILTGSKNWDEIISEYENLAAIYPEFIN